MKQKNRLWLSLMAFFYAMLLSATISLANNDVQEIVNFLQSEIKPSGLLLPADVTIVNGFKPGTGTAVGEVYQVHGTALVYHQCAKEAYKATEGMKLYNDDTLITRAKSRLNVSMYDKSVMTLAGQSKLKINRSIYDSQNDTRDTELELAFGQVSSIVQKVNSSPNYRIKTPTAIASVRGTVFTVRTNGTKSVALTGSNSKLSWQSRSTGKSVTVKPNSISWVQVGENPGKPQNVGAEKSSKIFSKIAPELNEIKIVAGEVSSEEGEKKGEVEDEEEGEVEDEKEGEVEGEEEGDVPEPTDPVTEPIVPVMPTPPPVTPNFVPASSDTL